MKRIYVLMFAAIFSIVTSYGRISPNMHFTHLDAKDGLSIGSVTSICFDRYGIVWIGTGYGLNSYDGNSVTQHIQTHHSNSIIKLCTDGHETLFIACYGELCGMDLRTRECTTLFDQTCSAIDYRDRLYAASGKDLHAFEKDSSMSKVFSLSDEEDAITAVLAPDGDSSLWVGTQKGHVIRIEAGAPDRRWNVGSLVESFYVSSSGDLLVATMSDGLASIGRTGRVSYIRKGLSSPFVRCMCEDDAGNLWIGTYQGLDCIEKESGKVISFKPELDRTDAISHSSIWNISRDEQGTLWIGTFFGGVNIINPGSEIYERYPIGKGGLSSPVIGKIQEASGNVVLIATEGGGLNVYDRSTGRNEVYCKESSVRHITENNIKDFLYERQTNTVWLGTHLGGVNRIDLNTGRTTHYIIDKPENFNANDVLVIVKHGDAFILSTRDGFYSLDPRTGKSVSLKELNVLSKTSHIIADSAGSLWVSGPGITKCNLESGDIKTYLPEERIACIIEDRNSDIWACGRKSGLYVYNKPLDRFEHVAFGDSWPQNELCMSMAESTCSNSLIITGQTGFGIYDRKTAALQYFGHEKGFPLTSTNARALACMSDGTVFMGGTTGLVSFTEDDLNRRAKPYKIFYTKFFVNGKEERPGGDILDKEIIFTDSVILPNRVSFFTFEFSSSNSVMSHGNDFECRLEGFSPDWISLGSTRQVSFSNLSPGNYTLHVRGTGERMCTPAKISIKVLPPWYKSWPAIVCFAALALLIVFGLFHFVQTRIRLKDQEALNQSKLRFFTNISHEIRTPLTMIIAQIESLMNDHNFTHSDYRKILSLYKNSISLRELITELLEFRKQEQGHLKIEVRPHNIVSLVHEHYCLFNEFALTKEIGLVLEKDIDRLEVWYDQKQMSKVLSNILSNALKYTPKGGTIRLKVWARESEAIIEVADSGRGIPHKDLDKIFTRFYRVNESDELDTGTGIGLSLSQGIVELHKGRITVESEEGSGTTFRIILPLGYSHFDKEQLEGESVEEKRPEINMGIQEEVVRVKTSEHKVVVAEDNEDIRNMLVELFSPFYTVFAAEDGAAALKLVQEEMPSLVVSDVIMPNMSGTELCREIKNNISTCHIPVVLLTARVTLEQNLEGLLQGADDYITKPFNARLLISRCNNLINSRVILQEKYRESPQMSTWALATNKMDKDFLERATEVILGHIADPEFNIAMFANEMAMSRTSLFDKIKAVTGKTPNDFILSIRLKEAARLLSGHPECNITEISERTGFSSARYFSSCFKNHYKVSPLQYRKSRA